MNIESKDINCSPYLSVKDSETVQQEQASSFENTYDEFLVKAGGFGRFQAFLYFVMMLNFCGVNFYQYNISFMELLPKEYICTYTSGETGSCTPVDFCSNPDVSSYEPDYSTSGTL
jgi:hypothetical protein